MCIICIFAASLPYSWPVYIFYLFTDLKWSSCLQKCESTLYTNPVWAANVFYHACFLSVSGDPCSSSYISSFSLTLSSALQGLQGGKKASSALNQNNYLKKCTAESVRGEGNEALRLLAICSLQSLLVISALLWKRSRTAWEDAMCSRHRDRRTDKGKGLMWTPVPRKYQQSLKVLAAAAAPLGTGSARG